MTAVHPVRIVLVIFGIPPCQAHSTAGNYALLACEKRTASTHCCCCCFCALISNQAKRGSSSVVARVEASRARRGACAKPERLS